MACYTLNVLTTKCISSQTFQGKVMNTSPSAVLLLTVILSGDYGIYGSITGAIVALFVAYGSKRMYRILKRDAGPRM